MTQFTHDTAPTQYVDAGGTRFAYRRFGTPGRPPLVFFQHFMGTLDDYDPALSDAFASDREVILFNNTGVASSSGTVPDTIETMARDAITFTGALGLNTVDIVGHSMGGLVAQEVALARPDLVRRLVLLGTGPRGAEGIGALPAWVAELFTRKYERQEDMWLPILFAPTETSQAAGRAYVERIVARADRDVPVSDQSIAAQGAALAAYGAVKDPSYAHLKGLRLPVLVVNGSDDIVVPTVNSYILQQFLPDAELILYPDANHGAHFQYPERFARHTRIILDPGTEEKTMTTTREPKIPGPEHPITIKPAGVRVVPRVGAQIVADTTRALTMRDASYYSIAASRGSRWSSVSGNEYRRFSGRPRRCGLRSARPEVSAAPAVASVAAGRPGCAVTEPE